MALLLPFTLRVYGRLQENYFTEFNVSKLVTGEYLLCEIGGFYSGVSIFGVKKHKSLTGWP
jgi:hypothetical protein